MVVTRKNFMEQTGKTILLVDDDLTLLEMYEDRLKAEGYTIIQAKNGEEALNKAREVKPALVILDVMMPKVNGFDVLKNLRGDEEFKNVPIIMLTALIQDVDRAQGKKLGATDYIVKSETMPGEVIAKIKKALGE
ncbi:MAG: Two component transcriptional regulator, winged helix family [Berkelbacteria bacterium GW2011_GWA1_36_9]|uniref:Two component transcriptional regulator, winged helix family n=1 Tax=Berkelbacteria bacterium GW2011_GWA1_36_9 TaxID=1618331 RepID=A0A0G0I210_9BACT|nr:MAG: Two component transcriptional regulator, winged helix family [Berkelbacteria bacterium GW2011_GWA1_36_9]